MLPQQASPQLKPVSHSQHIPAAERAGGYPSIRGYSSIALSSTGDNVQPRSRTPLLDPFARTRQPTSPSDVWGYKTASGSSPLLGLPAVRDPADGVRAPESQSYVASLGLAPLVSRPAHVGGQPIYIPGGASPMFPSSSQGSHSLGYPQYQQPTVRLVDQLASSTTNASPLTPQGEFSQHGESRQRQRTVSTELYLERREGIQHVTADTPGFPSTFLKNPRSRKSSKSRKGGSTASSKHSEAQSTKLGSRFIRYDSDYAKPGLSRRRSMSIDSALVAARRAEIPVSGRYPPSSTGLDQPSSAPVTSPSSPHNDRRARSRSRARGGSPELRKQERKMYNKLVTARIPPHEKYHSRSASANQGSPASRADKRMPSQPLGYTWICGSSMIARTPSFYEEFDYHVYPGGKRQRSLSRGTITPRSYAQDQYGAAHRRQTTGATATTGYTSSAQAYESEPESAQRQYARKDSLRALQDAPPVPTSWPATARHALHRKSTSLVNLRQLEAAHAAMASARDAEDAHLPEHAPTAGGLLISQPVRQRLKSEEFLRAPRSAPLPGGTQEIPQSSAQVPAAGIERSHSTGLAPSAQQGTSVSSQKSKEALFAALPPPSRSNRSPIPEVFTTGRVQSSTVQPSDFYYPAPARTSSGRRQPEQRQSEQGMLESDYFDNSGETADMSGSATSPPLNSIANFQASRVIIGETDLSAAGTPVVYDRAFATPEFPRSEEGVIEESALAESHSGSGSDPDRRRVGGLVGTASSFNSDSQNSMARQRSRSSEWYSVGQGQASGSAAPARPKAGQQSSGSSVSQSNSSTSAHVLDLNDESFRNLVGEVIQYSRRAERLTKPPVL